MLSRLRHGLASLLTRGTFESGLDTELRFHKEEYIADLIRSGVSREEALRKAGFEFGSVDSVKEECREARGLRWIDELAQDMRYTCRTMRNSPGFATAAIVSLALGIGVNTAIFSLMDAVLLRSMPVGNPEELYFIGHGRSPNAPVPTRAANTVHLSSNYPLFDRYRSADDTFSGVTAAVASEYKMDAGAGVEVVSGQLASHNFHSVLRVPFALGRGFNSADDRTHNAVAVLSHRLWTTRFGREPGVLGRTISVSGQRVTIIGVTASEFYGIAPGYPADLTLSMSLAPQLRNPEFFTTKETWTSLTIIGRLRPGVSPAQAVAATDVAFQQFITEPDARWIRERSPEVFQAARLEPAAKGMGDLRRRFSPALWVLFGIVLLVLAVACANASSLLLARASARQKEIAVRLSLGVSRARLLKQLLTESIVLSFAGGILGGLLAGWTINLLLRLISMGQNPIQIDVSLNLRVLSFTAAVAILCGILFGLAPSIRALRVDTNAALKGFAPSTGRFRAGKVIVAAQVAICVLLLTAATLFTRTLQQLHKVDGFQPDSLLLANLNASEEGLDQTQIAAAYSEAARRSGSLPGVRSASISNTSPISTNVNQRRIRVPGLAGDDRHAAWNTLVSPGFFETFRIEVLEGRLFNESDVAGRPEVAIVSESMARKFFAGSSAVGKNFYLGADSKTPVEIVGVVKNAMQFDPRNPPVEMIYTPLTQTDEPPSRVVLAIRAVGDPMSIVSPMVAEVRAANKNIAVQYVRTMPDQIATMFLNENLLARLSGFFAILAAVLACVGLYGVMSYTVARRIREMGVRIALGATTGTVRWLVIRQTLAVVATGMAIGVPIAFLANRRLQSLLFRIEASDPPTYIGVVALLAVAALLAAYWPAKMASRVSPIQALRVE